MKKNLFIWAISSLLFCYISLKALSYDNFDGRYGYNTWNNSNLKVDNNNEEVLFIVDYSNSMNGRIGYTSKLILTIDSLREILNKIDPSVKIGLRIFGFSENNYTSIDMHSNFEKEICFATKLVVPILENNNETILNELNRYSTRGATPIGLSLRQAVKYDFSPDAKLKHIILITDGGETCGDNPCAFIRELMRTRNDIKIDVIGITLQENQYSQLQCLAQSANGKFYTIDNVDDFDTAFSNVVSLKPHKEQSPPKMLPDKLDYFINKPVQNINYKNYLFEFKN